MCTIEWHYFRASACPLTWIYCALSVLSYLSAGSSEYAHCPLLIIHLRTIEWRSSRPVPVRLHGSAAQFLLYLAVPTSAASAHAHCSTLYLLEHISAMVVAPSACRCCPGLALTSPPRNGLTISLNHAFLFLFQDIMRLDNSARMNTPGSIQGNWIWRIGDETVWAGLTEHAQVRAPVMPVWAESVPVLGQTLRNGRWERGRRTPCMSDTRLGYRLYGDSN